VTEFINNWSVFNESNSFAHLTKEKGVANFWTRHSGVGNSKPHLHIKLILKWFFGLSIVD
jgi:hypothetical protein